MFLRKLILVTAGATLILGLLAACGEEVKVASNIEAALSPTPAVSTSSATPTVAKNTPAATVAPFNTSPSSPTLTLEPCSLFSKDDFKAVFNKEAQDPDNWEGVCDFEFADSLEPGSNVAFGLLIRLEKTAYTPEKFEKMTQLLRSQKVEGIGDSAYLKPSQAEDQSTALFVLKSNVVFSLELLEPATVSATQRLEQLKTAAQKSLAHLSAGLSRVSGSPTQPGVANAASKAAASPTPLNLTSNKQPGHDPCKLFTSADFVAILKSQPAPAQKDEDVAAYICNYQSATSGDTLNFYLQKESYDKARFEASYKDQLYSKTEAVSGLGDEAFWTEGPVSRLFVLKGKLAFWLELSLEDEATSSQKLDLLKKGAVKVLTLI